MSMPVPQLTLGLDNLHIGKTLLKDFSFFFIADHGYIPSWESTLVIFLVWERHLFVLYFLKDIHVAWNYRLLRLIGILLATIDYDDITISLYWLILDQNSINKTSIISALLDSPWSFAEIMFGIRLEWLSPLVIIVSSPHSNRLLESTRYLPFKCFSREIGSVIFSEKWQWLACTLFCYILLTGKCTSSWRRYWVWLKWRTGTNPCSKTDYRKKKFRLEIETQSLYSLQIIVAYCIK